ncbi:MAG: TadE/TadG family type IV pilus assembly protein [Devosia sp.]
MSGPLHSVIRFLRRDTRGAAAIEFALVVPVLLAIIFATLEAGWLMVQTIMLDRALDMTVRELRIGSFDNPTQERMRDRICDQAVVLADCRNSLALELIPVIDASSYPTDAARCLNRSTNIEPVLRFNPGQRSQMVFVRACYVVAPLTPKFALGLLLSKDANGDVRLVSKSGFINEPV